ncbi:MAG: hypothetical protein KGY81_09320 [Phycisphaerae bacterium]|nr:hypothetical protein [Phycisphaerae bacterium]
MAIIVSKNGRNAQKLEPSSYADEAYLQQYILQNPESLPLDEIDENIRLLVAAREFSTESGPIDALGLDGDGQVYVIETKLYTNTDKRRVLAQVLDYGAALWRRYGDFGEFIEALEEQSRRHFGMTLRQKVGEFFGLDDEGVDDVVEGARQCLSEGRLRFVILMDHLDERLKDLIVFVNQNSRYDIYGVELELYRHEDREILIPRLFGAEVRKSAASSTDRRRWDEASFLARARAALDQQPMAAVRKLLTFSKDRADDIGWGTGSARASFSPKFTDVSRKSIYTVYDDGTLTLNFRWLDESESAKSFADALSKRVQALAGVELPQDHMERFVNLPAQTWMPNVDQFIELIDALITEARSP